MDGKTPPTTSVVVDLERAVGYELAPGPGNTFFLNLHTAQEISKTVSVKVSSVPAPKVQTTAAKPGTAAPTTTSKVTVAAVPAPAAKIGPAPKAEAPKVASANATATKPVTGSLAPKVAVATASGPAAKAVSAASAITPKATSKPAVANTKIAAQAAPASEIKKVEAPKVAVAEPKKWAMNGKRDPFFSPVVQQNSGSGCSTGKKCLEIGQINVRGVVKAESGFIAVVTNSLNKAYFLHENDPVFNGFVVKITGDSVVFQETMQDKLGKPFTREVTKRITTPAV
jgi:Tfp pilus assembly protein PilP